MSEIELIKSKNHLGKLMLKLCIISAVVLCILFSLNIDRLGVVLAMSILLIIIPAFSSIGILASLHNAFKSKKLTISNSIILSANTSFLLVDVYLVNHMHHISRFL